MDSKCGGALALSVTVNPAGAAPRESPVAGGRPNMRLACLRALASEALDRDASATGRCLDALRRGEHFGDELQEASERGASCHAAR